MVSRHLKNNINAGPYCPVFSDILVTISYVYFVHACMYGDIPIICLHVCVGFMLDL